MNTNKDWTKFWKFVAAIALALSAFAVTLSGVGLFTPGEEATPRSDYQCAVYTEQGCAKYVVADGGEIEVQSGGTMDVQSGASVVGNVDITGTLQYGANDLYALGYASSGQQVVYGTSAVTGTEVVAHGLTTVTFCTAVLGEDPKTGANEAAFVTVAVAGNACTVKVWQDDWTSAATETSVVVQWVVIGTP